MRLRRFTTTRIIPAGCRFPVRPAGTPSPRAAHATGPRRSPRRGSVDGVEYDETVGIPKCAEAKVLEAATSAVKAGVLWVTNGPMSFCGEEPAASAIAKTAVLSSPPARYHA